MTRALVVVPAHDEAATLPAALDAVTAALVGASPLVEAAHVVVAAHRCTDGTADVARRHPGVLVVEDETSTTVGQVRDGAVRSALARLDLDPAGTWLLSTDADSHVPLAWVASLLGPAERDGAVAVAGMVELVDWSATPAAREAYARIIEGGLRDGDHHDHVYAANLAVRLDAYLAVGGFPSVRHGEETGLLAALRAAGLPVTSTQASVVRTSGRMPGRAAEGLGALLGRMVETP